MDLNVPSTAQVLLAQPTYSHHFYHQPGTHTSLDPYTPLKTNQSHPQKPYRLVKKHSYWFRGLTMPCWGVEQQWKQKGFFFCWFCVPVIWTGTNGASVRTPHARHAHAGSFKTDFILCRICWSYNKDNVLAWSRIILELKFTIFCNESLGCFYFRCVLSSQCKAVTVNLRILHCQL